MSNFALCAHLVLELWKTGPSAARKRHHSRSPGLRSAARLRIVSAQSRSAEGAGLRTEYSPTLAPLGSPLSEGAGTGVIQHSAFGIQHSTGSPEPVVRLPASAAALFDELADSPSIGPGSTHARLAPRAVGPLLRFLGLFLRYHLPDAPIEGRALALAALAR